MVHRHSWRGCPRARKLPSHPLSQKAYNHHTLCQSEILGMVLSHQSLDWSECPSKCLPCSCSLHSCCQCGTGPQGPYPASARTRGGRQASPTRGTPRAGFLPPLCCFPREPSYCLKPFREGLWPRQTLGGGQVQSEATH